MIDIDAMIRKEIENGYNDANAAAKVCQDLILKARDENWLGEDTDTVIKGLLNYFKKL